MNTIVRVLIKIVLTLLIFFVGSFLITMAMQFIPIAHGLILIIGVGLVLGGIGFLWSAWK